MHQHFIAHRDIKPDNILLREPHGAVLADLGVCYICDNPPVKPITESAGTPAFYAPECCSGEAFDPFAVDMWAFGVTMYAMLTQEMPFDFRGAPIAEDVIRDNTPNLSAAAALSPPAQDLLGCLLDPNPATRITVDQLLEHPWMAAAGHTTVAADAAARAPIEVAAEEVEAAITNRVKLNVVASLALKARRLARRAKSARVLATDSVVPPRPPTHSCGPSTPIPAVPPPAVPSRSVRGTPAGPCTTRRSDGRDLMKMAVGGTAFRPMAIRRNADEDAW